MEKSNRHFIDLSVVQSLMKLKGIDEKTMAKLLGFTLPTFKRFPGGADQRRLPSSTILKLAKVFNVTAHSLLKKDYP